MLADIQKDARNRMTKSLDSLRHELAKIRTGRAHPSLLEHVHVDYYGSEVPIGQAASVTVEDARTLAAAGYGVPSEDMTRLEAVTQIFRQTPGSPSPMHYGSRILFDGDGHAYITTGEHFTRDQRVLAQDLDTTYGKVVRVGLDGHDESGQLDEPAVEVVAVAEVEIAGTTERRQPQPDRGNPETRCAERTQFHAAHVDGCGRLRQPVLDTGHGCDLPGSRHRLR